MSIYLFSTFGKKISRGFTLIELIITISIVGIISAIALPNLGSFMVEMRVDNEISELHRLLLTARNSAINTGKNTAVCPLDGNVCAAENDWHGAVGVVDSDGVIKEKAAISVDDKLQFDRSSIEYTPAGRIVSNNSGSFKYCPSKHTDKSRGIDVSITGRVYSSTDTDNDGKDENRLNEEITCS